MRVVAVQPFNCASFLGGGCGCGGGGVVLLVSWGESPLFNSTGEETLGGILLSFLLAGRKRLGTLAGPGAFTPLIVSVWERVSRAVVALPVSVGAYRLCLDELFSVL